MPVVPAVEKLTHPNCERRRHTLPRKPAEVSDPLGPEFRDVSSHVSDGN